MGDVASLFPAGVTHLADVPHTFHDALLFALQALSWEELPKDERPPRNIWMDGKALVKHFKRVEAKRKAEMEPDKDFKHIDGPVEENEAAQELRDSVQ